MSNINRLQEMAGGTKGLNSWRLRDLKEEQVHQTKKELAEHADALAVAEKKLAHGDVAGLKELLTQIHERIGKTIEGLK